MQEIPGKSAVVVAGALAPATSIAQSSTGSIVFAPVSAHIPALGPLHLALLTLLLGGIAMWILKRPGGPTKFTVAVVFIVTLGTVGSPLLESARGAAGASLFTITDNAGQTFPVTGSENRYQNDTPVPMGVSALTLPTGCPTPSGMPLCSVGAMLEPGGSCDIDCAVIISDRRLKEAVVAVGVAANGLTLYEYRYLGDGRVFRGVMAQDVLVHTPAAVHIGGDGYLRVDYSHLDLELVHVD